MKKDKQEIFELLLNLHKKLLEEQKAEYEKIYGTILNANNYFQLVVSHEDFEWLRGLSALIASYDEGLESEDQDVGAVSNELVLLLSGDSDKKFYEFLKFFTERDQATNENIRKIIELLKNLA